MDHRAYWVWAQQAFGPGSRLPWELNRRFAGGLEEFYRSGSKLWNSLTFLTERQASALFDFSLSEAEARIEYVEKIGCALLTPECEKYPEPLRHISDPPAVLYVKGQLPDLTTRPAVGVAGARKALNASVDAARKIGYQLACGGAYVVSGGAVGIDAAALKGAMEALGQVICVLPVDLSSSYVSKNAYLRREIPEKGGALVSEYFLQAQPGFGSFQVRNRLITGLSAGVVLIQAAEKSGTMIYAKHALEQGRDVFVYPGPPEEALEYAGSRALIRDGAKAITCGEEVLEEYSSRLEVTASDLYCVEPEYEGLFDDIPLPGEEMVLGDPGAPTGEEPGLGPEAAQILAALGAETLTGAQLEERTGLNAGLLLSCLTELELEGRVESVSGRRYRRV